MKKRNPRPDPLFVRWVEIIAFWTVLLGLLILIWSLYWKSL